MSNKKILSKILKVCYIVFLVYLFLLSIKSIEKGAKLAGEGFAKRLITTTSNPFVGLFIGIISTALVQSSSLTTSLVVALVGGGILDLRRAVPIIMGANIGTSVTNTVVALTHISWRQEFKKAFSAATVHDFFNLLTVALLFPLELHFRYLSNLASFFEKLFENAGGMKFTSPLKVILSPTVNFLKSIFLKVSLKFCIFAFFLLGFILLFFSLFLLVRILKKTFSQRMELLMDKYIFRNDFLSLGLGFLLTSIVQSSSLTTSVIVPLVGAGVLRLERAFVYTMGANLGTTLTCLLASLAVVGEGKGVALTVALTHFLFNLNGILIFFPFKKIRQIPLILAKKLAQVCAKRRFLSLVYIIVVFFVIPICIILIGR